MARKTGDKLYKLNVAADVVKKTQTTIQGLYNEIGAILTQEREEMTLRKADMELDKLKNISEHQAEIHSRPRREWFQSKRQKKEVQERAKEAKGEVTEVFQAPKKTKHIEKKFNRPRQSGRLPEGQAKRPFQKKGFKKGKRGGQ